MKQIDMSLWDDVNHSQMLFDMDAWIEKDVSDILVMEIEELTAWAVFALRREIEICL
jgi:hypothetical protein